MNRNGALFRNYKFIHTTSSSKIKSILHLVLFLAFSHKQGQTTLFKSEQKIEYQKRMTQDRPL